MKQHNQICIFFNLGGKMRGEESELVKETEFIITECC